MSKKKHRESNIELLRIASMLIIVVYHFLSHAIIPNSPELNYITKPLVTVLHIGVVCFVLISGYWGIKFSLKGFITLYVYCTLYSVLIYCVGCLLNPDFFSLKNSIKSLVPYQWWFIPVYLCLYLLAPIINVPLKNASNRKKILFIVILGVISFGFGQFVPSLSTGKNPINFVLIYYLGNYLRTGLVVQKKITIWKIAVTYLLFNALLFLIIFFSEINSPSVGKIALKLFFPYNSIFLIVNSALFFIIFTQLKFSSRWVNWFASSALSVYLIHENRYIGHYVYDYIGKLQSTMESAWSFSIAVLLVAVLVFIVSVLVDKFIAPVLHIITEQITSSKWFAFVNKKVAGLLSPE